jgi:ribosome-binding factor A
MPGARRIQRLESLIKEEISLIFLHSLSDVDYGLITITKVKLSADAGYAKIYMSVYDKEEREEILEKVTNMKKFIRGELAQKIRVKHIPELDFFIDETPDHVERLEELFREIHKNDNEGNKGSE